MEKVINLLLEKLNSLPEFLDVDDLIAAGIYRSKNETYRSRLRGTSPHYIKMAGKILYPKEAIKAFILERFKDGSKPMHNQE